ncbi:MAG TPA: DUF433 domain-containing protein [Thermodesulfovibrionia bacterium]|nr:DUF433 domain-containing protein [Thermodesulfovibrionia bacterium]
MKNKTHYIGKPIEYTEHPHIVMVEGVASGEPIILGTRIMVRTIVEQYQLGNSIEIILCDYPQLSSAQIHDALSYYHDHKQDMDKLLNEATYEHWQPIINKIINKYAKNLS